MAGEPLLLLNIMSDQDRDQIRSISLRYDSNNPDNNGSPEDPFLAAVDALAQESQSYLDPYIDPADPNYPGNVGLTYAATDGADYQVAESKALTTSAASATGNSYLVFNDCEDCTGPVDVQIIEVSCPLYTGEIKVIEPENVFDNRVTLRHTGDCGGEPENREFNWLYCEYDGDAPPIPPHLTTAPEEDSPWKVWPSGIDFSETETNTITGRVEIIVEGEGEKTLSDKWFICQYKHDTVCTESWSEWTRPQLCQGWRKRMIGTINLYNQ